MYVNIGIYFPSSITFLWNTHQVFCLLSIGCYLLKLIKNNDGIKASLCIHHIFLAAVTNNNLLHERNLHHQRWDQRQHQ
jgi:hypothetical protein